MMEIMQNMNKQFVGNDFTKRSQTIDSLTPDMVDAAAELNMPLCMKNLHNNLKREHKLKHWGRLQYGLFLKGEKKRDKECVCVYSQAFISDNKRLF